eukprot:scaffold83957_cov39-Phaeocystis_antarctica.AAC.2
MSLIMREQLTAKAHCSTMRALCVYQVRRRRRGRRGLPRRSRRNFNACWRSAATRRCSRWATSSDRRTGRTQLYMMTTRAHRGGHCRVAA